MLLDSNIIIYAAKPEHEDLRRLIAEKAPSVTAVSYVIMNLAGRVFPGNAGEV